MRYQTHEIFTPPDDPDVAIWRYIDLTKLVALLDSASLFFARADTLGDEFEGSYSRLNVQLRPDVYKDIPSEALARISEFTSAMTRHSYVNCWNVSSVESAALWGLYVPPSGGVAIRSTFQRLVDCFSEEEADVDPLPMGQTIHVGVVHYVDYDSTWIPEGNTFWPFVHKRQSFEFEGELRAIIQDLPMVDDPEAEGGERIDLSQPSPAGRLVSVDLGRLIEAIYVSPVAAPWFSDLVQSVCARYGVDAPVVPSRLAGRPVY
jgi:hypothetical protein